MDFMNSKDCKTLVHAIRNNQTERNFTVSDRSVFAYHTESCSIINNELTRRGPAILTQLKHVCTRRFYCTLQLNLKVETVLESFRCQCDTLVSHNHLVLPLGGLEIISA